ncbi:MAG: hypothetical protein U9Q94_08005 [Candidatus Bipolaricaulota bacterium]|nr:hypothetical protein [Candidatus Bipolaricaulota bacterium]
MERQRATTIGYPLHRPYNPSRVRTVTWPRTTLAVICGAVIIAAACFLYVWQGTRILALTAQRESMKQTITSIEEVNSWLDFQIGQAFSLERVSRIAREQLHMSEPTDVRYVHIPPQRTEK